MANRLFLLIIAGLIGVVCNPVALTATDNYAATGLDDSNIVETVPLPEPEPVPEPERGPVPEPVKAPATGYTYTPPANSIQYAGRVIQIVDVGNTSVDAGGHVNKYGSRFLYGHNSWSVFGALPGLGAGSTFVVSYAGATTTYRVARTVVFEKNPENGLLQIDKFGDYMYSVASGIYDGVQYDMALMTCYGESYGNGDASHRFVVFANAV